MKKVVIFGGGTGLSALLRGLKLFPIDITSVIAVSDDGGSAGRLRKELNIPGIGDIRKVLAELSDVGPLMEELLQYRFQTNDELNNHAIGNLLLAALIKITGSTSEAVEKLSKILNIKGKILPVTEDITTLIMKTKDGKIIEGEKNIEQTICNVDKVYYKEKVTANPDVISEIEKADYIIFSMGSFYSSIVSNIIIKEIKIALKNTKAKKIFISNLMSECGSTNGLKVSDFIKVFDSYFGKNFLDVVISNSGKIDENIIYRYKKDENSVPIILDKENLKKYKFKLISDDFVEILKEEDIYDKTRVDKMVRHNSLKIAFQIFSYIMQEGD